MTSIMTFDSSLSMSAVAIRYPNQIPVVCVSASSKKAQTVALLMPRDAQVAALTAALRETINAKKAVQVFVEGALPSKDAALSDLCVDGGVRVTFSEEGVYGGSLVATPCGGAASW